MPCDRHRHGGVFAALACQLDKGDRVVASRALFGACYAILNDILPRWGVTTEFVDGTDLDLSLIHI